MPLWVHIHNQEVANVCNLFFVPVCEMFSKIYSIKELIPSTLLVYVKPSTKEDLDQMFESSPRQLA